MVLSAQLTLWVWNSWEVFWPC